MPVNDSILIDGIIEQRVAERGLPVGDAFEAFAMEQLLKDYDLSDEELEYGWVDGRNDGGIDGFFLFVNGNQVRDLGAFSWPRRSAEIEVWVITCKHHATFQQAPLNALLASLPELFDLSKGRSDLDGQYSEDLLDAKDLLLGVYRKLSATNPQVKIRMVYASRGDAAQVAENILARARQLERLCEGLFSAAHVSFTFIGSTELVQMHRRVKTFTLELPCLEYLSSGRSGYVVLVRLDDYYRFVTDENGNLRRYLFDSNVRDYLGSNTVNDDILGTLRRLESPDFWWLNNGVTVLATSAAASGKTIGLQDIQIVNGLQTTETIYRHFSAAGLAVESRAVLVKIIVTAEVTVRDQVIMATNNQSAVEPSALRASDKVQRDIEEVLERADWFYERRKNYYRNIGKPPARFVTPMYLAAGYIALVNREPAAAARVKTKFMRTDAKYQSVFSDSVDLQVWPAVVRVLKQVEEGLDQQRSQTLLGERFLANWRVLVGFLCAARVVGRFAFSTADLIRIDSSLIDRQMVSEVWAIVARLAEGSQLARPARNEDFVHRCCAAMAAAFGIVQIEAVKPKLTSESDRALKRRAVKKSFLKKQRQMANRRVPVSSELVEQVNALLPDQPWKPGTHAEVARALNVPLKVAWSAVQELVESGRRYDQKDGVVYGPDGKVLRYDAERVGPEALKSLADQGKLPRSHG